jgi:signal transduction histidine kinase
MPLSCILALRMVAVSVTVSLLLTSVFFLRYVSDVPDLREATLRANVLAIAKVLNRGQDPSQIDIYKDYPDNYGFRVFDRRLLATRQILASANTRWLPPVQHLKSTKSDPDGDRDKKAVGTDLFDGFEQSYPDNAQTPGNYPVSLLIHRVVLSGKKYWIQAYMIGDPAWAGLGVIAARLADNVLLPVLFIVPALTLAMFFGIGGALRPLRRLSHEVNQVGAAVARGQILRPLSGEGMAREFSEVANSGNLILGKLEKSLQLQKQFTSDAAHELRTPLAVLQLEASQLPPSAARDHIKEDLRDLGNLVSELLRFAQAEDAMAQELNDVDVVATARKVCEEAVGKALEKHQLIEFDCAAQHIAVPGNAALIEVAIRNLVENALNYSPSGTTVTVKAETGPRIIVEDQGPGIAPDQRDIVFERFRRADQKSGNGAGIGLALVRRIAHLHNGDVQHEDRPSDGTRMILSFASAETMPETATQLAGL